MKISAKVLIVFISITVLVAAPVVFVPNAISNASTQATTTPTQTTTTSTTTTPTFTPALHGRSVDIYFNDRLATWGDALPFIQSTLPSRTMVPIRFFSESIGAEVSWDGANKEVMVKISSSLAYDHIARQVRLKVGSDQAKVVIGDKETDVVLDTSVWQEENYPWRTFAPLRFVSEGLSGRVTWGGIGGKSSIFPGQTLQQDEVSIIYFFPVREEDYAIVPGERYGKYELRWSLAQLKDELNLFLTYEEDNRQNWFTADEKFGCSVLFGKGVFLLGQGYQASSPYRTVEGVSLGLKITESTQVGNYTPVTIAQTSASGKLVGYTLLYAKGLTISASPEWLVDIINVASPWYLKPYFK